MILKFSASNCRRIANPAERVFNKSIKLLGIVLFFVNTLLFAQVDSIHLKQNNHNLLVGVSLIGANTVSFEHQGVELIASKFKPSAEIHLGYELDFERRGQFVTRLSVGMLPQSFCYDIVPASGSPILSGSMAEKNAAISHLHKGYWDGFYVSMHLAMSGIYYSIGSIIFRLG